MFWGIVVAVTLLIGVAALNSGPVIWLFLGALPMLWALAFGAVLVIRGRFSTSDGAGIERVAAQRTLVSSRNHSRGEASHEPQAEDWWLASDGKWYPHESPPPSPQPPLDV